MKNAILLHGTGGTPESFWFPWLKKELTKKGYDVWVPQLPKNENPSLKESVPFVMRGGRIDKDTVLIGHSSGCPLILGILESLDLKIKKAILVAGFVESLDGNPNPILKDKYNWSKIKKNASEFVFINSDNDPWGCDVGQGKKMQEKLGGKLIVRHDGHMGSEKYNQPYKEFPLLLKLVN